jgi:hypothetical protein
MIVMAVFFMVFLNFTVPALPARASDTAPSDATSVSSSTDTETAQDTSMSALTDNTMRHVTGRESLQIDTFTVDREIDVRKDEDDITGDPKNKDHPNDLQGSFLGESGLQFGDVGFHDVRIHAFDIFLPSGSVIESEIPSMNGSVSIELLMPNSIGGTTKLGTISGGGFHTGANSKLRMELKSAGGDDFSGVLD